MVPDRGPFPAADDANVLDGQDCEEQILIGTISPALAAHCGKAHHQQQIRVEKVQDGSAVQ